MINKDLNKKEFRDFAVKGQGVAGSNVDRYINTVENMTRSVIEERPTRFAEIDVFSRLIMDRIIFLGLPVDDNISNIITAQLLFLQSTDAKKDIQLYVNSPGGSVYAGLGIYDTMQYVSPDVATICTGLAASMAAVLLSGGEKALTALSLLISLFRIKPSPFCILDEVDAPLDDVNVLRFVDTLKDLAEETQFLIITHNKLTMEVAGTLYGVTMEERGVSKLVAVEIDHIAAEMDQAATA